jgi:hypothetical protein
MLFIKQEMFQKTFGSKKLLQPNRYEINTNGPAFKTYIDGDQPSNFLEKYKIDVNDILHQKMNGTTMDFHRAKNPHSGFFMLSKEQFQHWESQKYFLDFDCSFVSPLESAASLGILKTFEIYKSKPNMDYFEIEHLDRKFSNLKITIS